VRIERARDFGIESQAPGTALIVSSTGFLGISGSFIAVARAEKTPALAFLAAERH
jgi:hypothetical protein